MILDAQGLYDIPVVEVRGELTDHYDPVSRQVRLSTEVFHRASIASAGVAAHEVGHAIQHAQNYKPLVLRTSIARAVNFSSQASIIIFMLGLLFMYSCINKHWNYIFQCSSILSNCYITS